MLSKTQTVSNRNIRLNNGINMPIVGFGTYRIRKPQDIFNAVDWALQAGYRLFDSAAVYRNEEHLRSAFEVLLPKYGLSRKDLFITTKLSPGDLEGKEAAKAAFTQSLTNLGMDYVDLYLIHFPGNPKFGPGDKRNSEMRDQVWEALTELYNAGKAKAIGVSNFTVRHLQDLRKSHSVIPAVNQVECHPYYPQTELLDYCRSENIALQAYGSLGGTYKSHELTNDPVVKRIAGELGVSGSQVLLAWAVQQGIAVIPKSLNPEHIKDNMLLGFQLNEEHMKALDSLSNLNIKYAWSPDDVL